ncbi:ArsB/NhaD family transporter [Rubrobacter calidifluminis]|uniref:ArsB/NhaD family transporter n=1 Tax=Rubrobacter calidifluminis TaxID=1392640 RepID=UPI00235EA5B1|nr:ArsB/NhaD family transporter [Rubrobacter calidifluminis]
MSGLFAGLIFVVTLALILTRPHGIGEVWWAAAGGVAVLVFGLVSLQQLEDILETTQDALIFLIGLMAVSAVAERAGFFEWVATRAAQAGGGSALRLYVFVFMAGTLVTAFLSLDSTAIVLTPVVYVMVSRLRLPPLPFMFACTYTANTASLFLPVSNLTNLLFYNALGLGFLRFSLVMLLPALLAVVANAAVFFWLFRREIRGSYGAKPGLFIPREPAFFRLAAAGVAVLLAGFFVASALGVPIGVVSLCGGVLLVATARWRGWVGLREVAGSVSWGLVVLVVGLFVVVRAVENAGLSEVVRAAYTAAGSWGGPAGILVVAAGTALGANLVNNVPMAVVSLGVLPEVHHPALAYASLLGTNIGPNLTVVGSLATLIWLSIVRGRGMEITSREYLRVGMVATPVILAAASLGLWISLGIFGP